MPNRVIKESIKRSSQIDSLTWFEEVVFYRLIVTADDYGCIDGRPVLIKNELFPTRENVTRKSVEDAITKLVTVGLLCQYEVDGRSYLVFPTWEKHQRIRNKHRKYPAPPDNIRLSANCCQTSANCQSESESNPNPNPNPNPNARARRADQQDEIFADFPGELGKAVADWLAYKTEKRQGYKPTGLQSLLTQIRNAAKEHGDAAVVKVIRDSMAANYQGIVFDRLSRQKAVSKAPEPVHSSQPSKADQEHLKRILEGMGG